MKKIYILIATVVLSTGTTFGQLTCATAVQESSNTSCDFTSYVATDTEFWVKFTAVSEHVNIEVITTQFGSNVPHIHGITLFSGTCTNLIEIGSDELAFFSSADRIAIDLDSSPLIVGNIYFIKLSREASGEACPRIDCFPVINPATFIICIEEIDVFIPLDFGLETPAPYHTYYQNRGQLLNFNGFPAKGVKLYTMNSNPAVYLFDFLTSFVFSEVDEDVNVLDKFQRVDMILTGASPTRVFKTEKTNDVINHYLPHIPRGITNTKGFSRSVCNEVYSGVDMQFYSNPQGVKFYFVVKPNEGNADDIIMRFFGADSVRVTGGNGLLIETALGNLEFEQAHVYRIHPTNNNLVPMPASGNFIAIGNNEFKFDIQNYPNNWTLVITVDKGHTLSNNPAIDNLLWSTYWGGIGWDFFYDVKTDADSNVYISGYNWQGGFPSINGLQTVNAGDDDAIIIKLNNICERQWATYYGGTGQDQAWSIAADNTGDVYVVGQTESKTNDFPLDAVCGGVYCDSINDCTTGSCLDAFIIRLDNNGVREWATFYGENDTVEFAWDVALNSQKDVYVTGVGSAITDLVVEAGAFNDTKGTGLIMKFDSLADRKWVTLFGSTGGTEEVESVAIDNNDNVYITGRAVFPATDFPIVNPGGNPTHAGPIGGFDAFATRFDANDSIIWSTFYGGTGNDEGNSIAVNDISVYVGGETTGGINTFDTPGPANFFEGTFQGGFGGTPQDGFIVEFDNSVTIGSIIWATYIGGGGNDRIFDIVLDDDNFIYAVGASSSNGVNGNIPFPTNAPPGFFVEPTHETGFPQDEGFITAFKQIRTLVWTTNIGSGPGNVDGINGVATVGTSDLYTAGLVFNSSNPPFNDYPIVDFDILNPLDYYQDTTPSFSATAHRWDISGIAVSVGIDEESGVYGSFLIYPNPSDGQISVLFQLDGEQDVSVNAYNILGARVYNKDYGKLNGRVTKDLQLNVSRGMYMIEVQIGKERITEKLIIR